MLDIKTLTEELKRIMQIKLNNQMQYDMWIRVLEPINMIEKTLYLQSPGDMFVKMINERFSDMLNESLNLLIDQKGNKARVIVTSPESKNYEKIMMQGRQYEENGQQKLKLKAQNPPPNLNPRYTFDNFIKGKSNELALAASENISKIASIDTNERTYNPLFIHGESGLGKTHLMQAIAHRVLKTNPEKYVMYISSEKFTNEMIKSLRENKTEEFRAKFRSVDVLLIDDIQFIADKVGTQEEFFHTFEDLYNAGKYIVLSSDKPPREINKLEKRLVSRFGWGIIVDISRPDFETRVAILQNKSNEIKLVSEAGVVEFLAQNIEDNIRELEGALYNTLAVANVKNKKVAGLEDAESALRSMHRLKERKLIDTDHIIETVAQNYSMKKEEILSKSRKKEIVLPRQIAMFLARELTNESLMKIAKTFKRDHTTIMHGFDKIDEKRKEDKSFDSLLNELIEKIRS